MQTNTQTLTKSLEKIKKESRSTDTEPKVISVVWFQNNATSESVGTIFD